MESTTSRKSRLYYGGLLLILFNISLLNSSFNTVDTAHFMALVTDSDGDGVPDHIDIDDDNDGIVDSVEDFNVDGDDDPTTNPNDSDQDGIPDYLDEDSDGTDSNFF